MPAFITDDGEVFEIPDLPEDLGRACALASEATLRKFWDTSEEDEAWQHVQTPSHSPHRHHER